MTLQDQNSQDVTRTTLAVLFIVILIATSTWILRPFLTAIVWSVIIVVATWPILLKFQKWFWGRRGLAVVAMTIMLLLVVVVPLTAAIASITSKAEEIATRVKSLAEFTPPPPPGWVSAIPLVGRKLDAQWQQYASLPPEELTAAVVPYARIAINWFLSLAGGIVAIVFQFLLTVIISAIMYGGGEKAAAGLIAFARRLAGPRGEEAALLAGKAVRSVALGIVVTALIQTAIGAAGLLVCGVPAVPLLTALVFVLCLAQLGPLLVLLPSVIWLYWKGEPFWGTVMLVFMLVANTIDNFLRPVLIKKGVDLPLIMIFAGVIGGLISFGVIGLFIGPVVLAVSYTLLEAWVSDERPSTSNALDLSEM